MLLAWPQGGCSGSWPRPADYKRLPAMLHRGGIAGRWGGDRCRVWDKVSVTP